MCFYLCVIFLNYAIQTNINKTYGNSSKVCPSVSKEQELERIFENCQLKQFDAETQIAFRDAIERLYYCEVLKIGSSLLPGHIVHTHLRGLDYAMLAAAERKLHKNRDRPVKNMPAYIMSVIFNAISEESSIVLVDPYLNSLRKEGG